MFTCNWDGTRFFFSVGVGQGRSENPLQCHRLVSSTLKQCLWSKENRALVSLAWLTRGLCLWEPWRNVVTEAYLISNLESNWRTEIAIVAQRTRSRSQFADDIFSSQQGVMCLMSALESGLHFLLNDPFFGAISACSPICLEDVKMIVVWSETLPWSPWEEIYASASKIRSILEAILHLSDPWTAVSGDFYLPIKTFLKSFSF